VFGNAIKFTHEDGSVQVRASKTDERLLIEVEDQCGGLSESNLEELLKPFVQGASDVTGFGLGLAFVKQAVEAHGDQVRVHNLPGRGASFRSSSLSSLPFRAPRKTAKGADNTSCGPVTRPPCCL
jgi:signal transduction histidine kinase